MIALVVHVAPVAQPRPRVTARGGHARGYVPASHPVHAYRAAVAAAARQACPEGPMQGPVSVHLVFVLPRPQRLQAARYGDGLLHHDRRPDVDNLVKSTLDALQGVAYADDGQVAELRAAKAYAERGGRARVEIVIEGLRDTA